MYTLTCSSPGLAQIILLCPTIFKIEFIFLEFSCFIMVSATDKSLVLQGLLLLTCNIDDIDNALQTNKCEKYVQTPLPSIILSIFTPADIVCLEVLYYQTIFKFLVIVCYDSGKAVTAK